jgi:adenylosuccinate lyase
MRCWEDKTPFPETVRADKAIADILGSDRLDIIFDVTSYLANEQEILNRVLPPESSDA